jgi:phosphonate transport system substrate-binding protein
VRVHFVHLSTVAVVAASSLALGGCERIPFPERSVDLAATARPPAPPPSASVPPVLRFSVAAMQSPQETLASYEQFLDRFGARIGMKVELVQRRTYEEVNELLVAWQLDAAILCTGGWLVLTRDHPDAVEPLAVPVVKGESVYRSFLIVPAGSKARSLADLRGKRFAFSDELSLTGHQWIVHELRDRGEDPVAFFGRTEFTHSNDRSVDAVARGVVDGASVDSLLFDLLALAKPSIRESVRIIERSEAFGLAPVVASKRLPAARRAAMREALLTLSKDPASAAALRSAGFDGFSLPGPHHFDSAIHVVGTR